MKNTYVYFIQEKLGELAPVKIGVAKNPEVRLAELQIGNPRKLILLTQIGPVSQKRAYHLEKQLHRKLKRHKLRGEWFTGVVLSKVKELKSGAMEKTNDRR